MADKFRMERIERLLNELRYEIERGMMEREVEETLGFTFVVPTSSAIPGGMVWCEFRTRPTMPHFLPHDHLRDGPRLRVISGGREA